MNLVSEMDIGQNSNQLFSDVLLNALVSTHLCTNKNKNLSFRSSPLSVASKTTDLGKEDDDKITAINSDLCGE